MMETRVVEEARVRAEVKRAHMRALKARFRRKNICAIEGGEKGLATRQSGIGGLIESLL